MDLFLKFESADQAQQYLYNDKIEYRNEDGTLADTIVNEDGAIVAPEGTTPVVIRTPKFLNLDIIGDIYKSTGETTTDENGFVFPVMEKLDGYHVNIRTVDEDASALEQFAVVPNNPVRVWA